LSMFAVANFHRSLDSLFGRGLIPQPYVPISMSHSTFHGCWRRSISHRILCSFLTRSFVADLARE
jgi:hypothetical protein